MQVDDAGVLSLGFPQYSATQYWTFEPVEAEHYIPQQQPMVVEIPTPMEPITVAPNVAIAEKRATVLGIVIMVVSILMAIGGFVGGIISVVSMINPPEYETPSGVVEKTYASDYIIEFLSSIFTIALAGVGIASAVRSVKTVNQMRLLYAFIGGIAVKILISAVMELTTGINVDEYVEVFGSVAAVMAAQWFTFALCIVGPAAACITCAAFRVKYLKQVAQTHVPQVDHAMRDLETPIQD